MAPAEGRRRAMPRLRTVGESDATGKVKEIYDSVKSRIGMIPNIFKGMASSPVALQAYVALDQLISEGKLSGVEQEIVRLVVSQFNGCQYCLAAHSLLGKLKGLSDEQIMDIRRGKADDAKYAALVQFTRRVLESKGLVTDEEIAAFRAAGYSDEHMGEVVTIIAQKTLSNFFNHINDTQVDFPPAPEI